ncbi:MAG: helix-turn-helix domain containing protein [Vallitaleaceae bacterium]|jgi:AcrR family transcriptional regulator|nr:helix-turn-helix domain containing protein [Vallitaleaceae bacterium]
MAPKVQFTKEELVETAFQLAIEEGLAKLTVRKVATRLGCSVAPIYVNFSNANDLNQAVLEKIATTVWGYLTKSYTDIGFLNMGIGQILFAKDYPRLFNDLMVSGENCMDLSESDQNRMLDIMGEDSILEGFTREDNASLLLKMSLFTHGISSSIANGLIPKPFHINDLVDLLDETGFQLIASMRSDYEFKPHPKKYING